MVHLFSILLAIFCYFAIGLAYYELNNKAINRAAPPFVVVIWMPLMLFYGTIMAVYGFFRFLSYIFGIEK